VAAFSTFMGSSYVPPRAEEIRKLKADFAVVGAAFEGCCVGVPGASHGPRVMRQISDDIDYYNVETDIDLREHIKIVDCGDVGSWRTATGDTSKAHKEIEDAVAEITKAKAIPIVFGGDHSITLPAFRGFHKETKGKIGVVHFDTHLDTADVLGGEKVSNCTQMKRMTELGDRVPPRNMVHAGIRFSSFNIREERKIAEKLGMKVFYMGDIIRRGIAEVTKEAIDIAKKETDLLYFTLDIDVLDAPYAPATSVPTPGGLTNRELIEVCRLIGKSGVDGFDVVEVSGPMQDPNLITARIAATCVAELMGATVQKRLR